MPITHHPSMEADMTNKPRCDVLIVEDDMIQCEAIAE